MRPWTLRIGTGGEDLWGVIFKQAQAEKGLIPENFFKDTQPQLDDWHRWSIHEPTKTCERGLKKEWKKERVKRQNKQEKVKNERKSASIFYGAPIFFPFLLSHCF